MTYQELYESVKEELTKIIRRFQPYIHTDTTVTDEFMTCTLSFLFHYLNEQHQLPIPENVIHPSLLASEDDSVNFDDLIADVITVTPIETDAGVIKQGERYTTLTYPRKNSPLMPYAEQIQKVLMSFYNLLNFPNVVEDIEDVLGLCIRDHYHFLFAYRP